MMTRAESPAKAAADREPEREPLPAEVRPSLEPAAVPISGLAAMQWPAGDLLWEWSRWIPPVLPVPLAGPPAGPQADAAGPLPESRVSQPHAPGEPAAVEAAPDQAATQQVVAGPAPGEAPGPEGARPTKPTEPAARRGRPAAPAEPGAAGAQEPAAEGDVATPEGGLPAWSTRLRAAIKRRVVARPLSDPEVATTPIRESVSDVRRREVSRRGGSLPGVKAAMPKAPVLPDDLPPPPALPNPEAEDAVKAALGKQLPRQVLPELQDYVHTAMMQKPTTFKPKVFLRLPEGTTSVLTPVPPPPAPGREGRAKLAKVKAAGKVEAQPGVKGAFTLGTAVTEEGAKAPPKALPGPPVTRADVAGVLVRLLASVRADSTAILISARSSMYGQGVVQRKFPRLGEDELLPGLIDRVGAGVDAIASRYRVDLGILHAATLDQHGKIQGDLAKHVAAVDGAADKAEKDTAKEGQASADTIAGATVGADAAVDAKLLEASGGASPAAIRAQRDRLIGRVNRRLAPEDIRYEKEGEDRLLALREMEGAYVVAYKQVADQVAAKIRKETEPPPGSALAAPVTPTPIAAPPPPPSSAPPTPAEAWAIDRIRDVRAQFTELRKTAQEAVKANRGAINSARNRAIFLFTRWADREIGDRVSAWDRLWDWITTWGKAADDRILAWEEAKMANLAVDLQGDIAFVSGLASGARTQAEMEAVGALGGLSKAQQKIMTAYFEQEPPRNPLEAVAAGMRVRIAETTRPRLVGEIDKMLYALPATDLPTLDALVFVADSLGNGDGIKKRGNDFFAAVDQWGTDEAKVYASLSGMTKIQRHVLDKWYRFHHHSSIDDELEDELSDAELDRARDLMAGDQLAADAAAIRAAIEGPGTDEEEIYRALRNKTAEERSQLEAIYLSRYKVTLEDDLDSDLSGQEKERAMALRAGDVRKADAIGLEYAQSGKWYGGVDTDAIQKIYATNRAELEAEAADNGWDSKQINAAVLARNQEIDTAHKRHFRLDAKNEGPGLRASFEKNLTGPARDLALGLQDQDWARADAARLELERRSFITKDKIVNEILESQYTRARAEVVADEEHQLAYRRDLAILRGEHWDDKAQRDAMKAGIEAKARGRSAGYMTALKKTYDTAYKYDPIYAVNGRGGFDNLIDDHLTGSDKDRAKALVKGGGYLSPAQEIKFAVQGPGTDVDVIKRVLAGKTRDEIKAIADEWQKMDQNGPSLRDRVMDEVSGRDAFDIEELFRGEPQTPQEKLDAAVRKQRYEETAYGLGSSKADRAQLDHEVEVLKQSVEALKNAPPSSDEAKYYAWEVNQGVKNVDAAVEEHRRGVDAVTDRWAMIAAVVAGVAVTALTFGAAGPAVAGALGALAAAEATITAKLAVKGSAYSDEEILVDVVSGAVDVVFAVLTAGVGNALMRVSEGIPVGPLAKLATSASRAKRMVAHGLANGVEGFLSGIPSAAAGSLADEKTWTQGDAFTNFITATGMGAATGTLMGGAMGSVGGWSKAAAQGPHLDPGRPPDLDAAAKAFDEARLASPHVDPEARAGLWHAHQGRHPGASYADFLADLDAGRIAPDPAAGHGFQRAARGHLSAGLPSADRKLIEGVPVRVLDDAEFGRLTRSSSGQAATIVEGGKPVVLIRESAPLAVLREEGIHAAQLLDPKLAAKAQLLDEARMVEWSSLDLRTKMKMYAAKLDLEIDAHVRLIKGLMEELGQVPPGLAREALEDQVGAARRNFRNLADRKIELASFGPLDRLKARLGVGTLATRLEQPPRLFSKATPPAEILSEGRPDIAQRFQEGDEATKEGRVRPSQKFNEAVSVLMDHGLTDDGLTELVALLFAPGRRGWIGTRRFGDSIRKLQTLAERVRNDPDQISARYRAKRLASLRGYLAEIVDEARRQRGAHTVRGSLEDMLKELDVHRGRTPVDGIVGLFEVMVLEGKLARTWETVRSLQHRFTVSKAVLTPEGGPPVSLFRIEQPDARSRRLARLARIVADIQAPGHIKGIADPIADQKVMGMLRLGALDIMAHGAPGESLERSLPGMSLEKYMLGATDFEDLVTSPPGLADWLSRVFANFERAHLVGPGFGDELFTGLALAPRDFNQKAQNRGVEKLIRKMVESGLEPEVKVTMSADRLAIPLKDKTFEYIDVVRHVEYTITHGETTGKVSFDVDGPPKPGWRVVHNDFPEGVPGGDVLHGLK